MKTDSIFYRIFKEYPTAFFELLGEPAEIAQHYQFNSVEVKQTAFRIDGMFVSNVIDHPSYFVEVQFQKDNRFFERTISEIFLFLGQDKLINNWRFIVWVANSNILPALPVKYQIIQPYISVYYLDQLAKKEPKSLGVRIIGLVVCEPDQASEIVPKLILDASKQSDSNTQRIMLDLIDTVLIYKFAKLSYQELTTMFGLNELKQTRVFQEAKEIAKEEVREQIREEVKEEVREQIREEVKEEVRVKIREEVKEEVRVKIREETFTEAKLQIAKSLLSLGVSMDQVSVATGLSLAELEKL